MAPESSRIAELRRRVQEDPASIAFAQLAEEYRRLGRYEEAVSYCRSGLARHPEYLSARVTLARALVELGAWAEAEAELDVVLGSAPDNLVALRAMAEVQQNRGAADRAREFQQRAFALARATPELGEIAGRIDCEIAAASPVEQGSEAPVEPLLDFDSLLASLGVPTAAPPPLIETMLSGSMARLDREVWASEASDAGGHEDAFSALERELRAFEDRKSRNSAAVPGDDVIATDARDGGLREVGDGGLGELEAWLQALSDDRTRSRSAT